MQEGYAAACHHQCCSKQQNVVGQRFQWYSLQASYTSVIDAAGAKLCAAERTNARQGNSTCTSNAPLKKAACIQTVCMLVCVQACEKLLLQQHWKQYAARYTVV
jgi:hypothetical protein